MFFGGDGLHERYIVSDEYTTDGRTVAVQKFGGGVHDEICSVAKGLLQVGRGECVIASNLLPVFFCQSDQCLQVDALQGWVGGRFQVDHPDGRIVDVETLLSISNKLATKNGHLIVDEAFIDVLDPTLSLVPLVEQCNAIILRSFGKTYGLAGLRLGFAITPREIAARIRADLGPWAISGPAIDIGMRALAEGDWLAETSKRLQSDIKRLDQLLRTLGLEPLGGSALFRLAKSADASSAFNALAENGILVRAFRDKPNWLRFGMPGTEAGWSLLENRTRGIKLS